MKTKLYNYVCPDCGRRFEQGNGNYNYETGSIDFECPECGWTGTENDADPVDPEDEVEW